MRSKSKKIRKKDGELQPIQCWVRVDLKKRLAHIAIDREMTLRDIFEQAIHDWIKKHG